MLHASGMQLIFLPKSPKINRRVWQLLKVALCVQGGGGEGQLSPPKLETTSRGEEKVQNHRWDQRLSQLLPFEPGRGDQANY